MYPVNTTQPLGMPRKRSGWYHWGMARGRANLESLLLNMFTDVAQSLYDRWKQGTPETHQDNNPYRILGVEPGDPPEMVTAVFRAKVKILHPDKQTGNAEKFKRLKAAYDAIREVSRK